MPILIILIPLSIAVAAALYLKISLVQIQVEEDRNKKNNEYMGIRDILVLFLSAGFIKDVFRVESTMTTCILELSLLFLVIFIIKNYINGN